MGDCGDRKGQSRRALGRNMVELVTHVWAGGQGG